jgi:putative DNA primase/helicase
MTHNQSITWPAPEELVNAQKSLPYPIKQTPEAFQGAVIEVADAIQAPVAMVGSSALSTLSAAAQSKFNVNRDGVLTGSTGLYVLTVAMSGDRKSSVDGVFTQAITDFEREKRLENAENMQAYNSDFSAWEAKRRGILTAISSAAAQKKETSLLYRDLKEHDKEQPERPRVPQLMVGEPTTEGLKKHLSKKWPSGFINSAEAGEIFGGHSMRKDMILAALASFNKLWSGETIAVSRASEESFVIESGRLTLNLQLQKESLDEFLRQSGTLARGSGFWARFLMSFPASLQGTRLYKTPQLNGPYLEAFNRRIKAILEKPDRFDENGILQPEIIEPSPEAKQEWIEAFNAIEAQLAPAGDLRDVRDVASKTAENAARIAALIEIFTGGHVISCESMRAGIALAMWHLQEAQRFFGEINLPAEQENAVLLDGWLIAQAQKENTNSLPFRKLQQCGPNRIRSKELLDAALQELVDAKRVAICTNPKTVFINPALLAVKS